MHPRACAQQIMLSPAGGDNVTIIHVAFHITGKEFAPFTPKLLDLIVFLFECVVSLMMMRWPRMECRWDLCTYRNATVVGQPDPIVAAGRRTLGAVQLLELLVLLLQLAPVLRIEDVHVRFIGVCWKAGRVITVSGGDGACTCTHIPSMLDGGGTRNKLSIATLASRRPRWMF